MSRFRLFLPLSFILLALPASGKPIARHFAAPAPTGNAGEALAHAEHKRWPYALSFALRASPLIAKAVTWEYLLDPESGATFQQIASFIQSNPDWPEQKRLHLRAEQAMRNANLPDADVIAWFGTDYPISGIGKVTLAEALARTAPTANAERVDYLLRDAWRNGDFTPTEETYLLTQYGSLLRTNDHAIRADRLLWEEKTAPLKRMLPLLAPDWQALAAARDALIEGESDALKLALAVPQPLKTNAGLLYDLLRYYSRRKDDNMARQILLAAPATVPYPEKWWKLREQQVRKSIDEENIPLARRLLQNSGQTTGSEYAEQLWLSGWLSLTFEHNPAGASQAFNAMFQEVATPVSKARAAYWSGRAAEAAGNAEGASNWYRQAAAAPTSFYGQLASAKLGAPLNLPVETAVTPEQKKRFEQREMPRTAIALLDAGAPVIAGRFIYHLIDNAQTDQDAVLAAKLAGGQKPVIAVRAAKRALQRGIVIPSIGYPKLNTPPLAVEPALAMAIARQESEFDPGAQSAAGAIGLMQLLPGTAKETARKNDIKYSASRLPEPAFNLTLGSLYLGRLITLYEGSYIKAIAAYNAGPGNVRDWSDRFGNPGGSVEDSVTWIEKIPFAETRNYVQRVLENLQVYRRLGGNQPLQIEQDMLRGSEP